jgi:hypothetical protein
MKSYLNSHSLMDVCSGNLKESIVEESPFAIEDKEELKCLTETRDEATERLITGLIVLNICDGRKERWKCWQKN